jgi:hypothetical protein
VTYLVMLGAFVTALMGVGYVLLRQDEKRAAALRLAAERQGWRFEAKPDGIVIPGSAQRELFTQGRAQKVRNHMVMERDGRQVAVFDYQYTTGAGKSQRTWKQTVAHVHAPGLDLPAFVLRPENVFHKIGGMFGYQDIDLDTDPDFSGRYLLRGVDEAAIRALFTADVRDFYDRHAKSCTEAAGADLFFWRTDRRVAPEDVAGFVDEALVLTDRLQSAAAAAGRS